MSAFLGQSLSPQILPVNDDSVQSSNYRKNIISTLRPWEEGRLWTSSSFLGGASAGIFNQDSGTSSDMWANWPDEAGSASMKKLIGVTNNSSGSVLGGVTVVAVHTTDNLPQGVPVVSDAQGYYELLTPLTDNHRIDAYLAGSPDVAGTTVNNLTPV